MNRFYHIHLLWVIFLVSNLSIGQTDDPEPYRNPIGKPRVINGPMVGWVSPTEITIWARVTGDYAFSVQYDTDPDMTLPNESEQVLGSPKNDFSVQVTLKDLQPDTTYYYRVLVEGKLSPYHDTKLPYRTKTAPARDEKVRFTIGFGSCVRIERDRVQPIWNQVRDIQPDLFFWLGDNIYGDSLFGQFLAEEYRSQRQVGSLQSVLRSIPNLAIWDDHDYGLNGHDRENPIKDVALEVFKNYWANPGYGLPNAPGVFFQYSYGGVDFFFLDGRYYRDPATMEDGPDKTFLGEKQFAWLKEGLRKSRAPFKLLISGNGWTTQKGERGDTWASCINERNQLFDFIRDEKIGGVLLMSGDTHQGELNCIPWSEQGGYDMYEFVSSPLAQGMSGKLQRKLPEIYLREWYQDAPNFGYIIFDLRQDDPVLRFNLIDVFGDFEWDWFEIRASELVNGVKSWPDKIDEAERMKREFDMYPDLPAK